MKRKIIKIDETKCDGCGQCIPNCPEGAIQLLDGKARVVSDLFCDGLGACLGHCPLGAISVEEREAAPYDERKVMANVVRQGQAVIDAHLEHLRDHNETEYLQQALAYLKENPMEQKKSTLQFDPVLMGIPKSSGGCPGSRSMSFAAAPTPQSTSVPSDPPPSSALNHWPIQLHLLSPNAAHYRASDLLLAADCVPFALAGFHQDWLRGKTLAIACPKLDHDQQIYLDKLVALIDEARINTLTVIIMQVPCCGGLLRLAQAALAKASRKIPIKSVIVSLQGAILKEEWV
jgi:ferredoxin